MYDRMTRHAIQVLRAAGLTAAQVADHLGVSPRTAERVATEPPITAVAPAEPPSPRGPGRPRVTQAIHDALAALLVAEPRLPTVEALHRMRQQGYGGSTSAFYALAAALRPHPVTPLVRFEGLPGEFSQHDFGQVEVTYADDTSERLHFFASRLKYSRWVDVRLVPNEGVEALVRSLLRAFAAFGGVPLAGVFDNPKTVVLHRRGDTIEWNPVFGQVALDYRFAPELCTPRRAQEKGAVENLVGWVKGSFFKVRRFHDRADLEAQLTAWHHEANHTRPCRATGVPPAARLAAEQARLRPLPIAPADYALRFPIVVGPTARVTHGGASYSMPPAACGVPGTLHLYADRVRIVAGPHTAEHPRVVAPATESVQPAHRAAMLAAVAGKRGQRYFKRQQLLALGAEAETLLTELVHRHAYTWSGDVDVLFECLQRVGPVRLVAAIRTALARACPDARFVVTLCEEDAA